MCEVFADLDTSVVLSVSMKWGDILLVWYMHITINLIATMMGKEIDSTIF